MGKYFDVGLYRYPEGYYVYFVTPEKEEDTVKIGISKDPFRRRETLQIGNSKALKLHLFFGPYTRQTALEIERDIHTKLCSRLLRGEWFKVDYRVCWQFFDTEHMKYFDVDES
jgi:hypothetical protein